MVSGVRCWHILQTGAPGRAAELCGVLRFSRKPPVKSKAETKKAIFNALSSLAGQAFMLGGKLFLM